MGKHTNSVKCAIVETTFACAVFTNGRHFDCRQRRSYKICISFVAPERLVLSAGIKSWFMARSADFCVLLPLCPMPCVLSTNHYSVAVTIQFASINETVRLHVDCCSCTTIYLFLINIITLRALTHSPWHPLHFACTAFDASHAIKTWQLDAIMHKSNKTYTKINGAGGNACVSHHRKMDGCTWNYLLQSKFSSDRVPNCRLRYVFSGATLDVSS